MESKLSGLELIRLTGAEAFIRGSFRAHEGLAGIAVQGGTIVGSMYDFEDEDEVEAELDYEDLHLSKTMRSEICLTPPFANRCTCRKGGGCTHVATVALTYLYRQIGARRRANEHIPAKELAVYDMPFLVKEPLRFLAVALLGAFPEGASMVAELMAERRKKVSHYEDHIWK